MNMTQAALTTAAETDLVNLAALSRLMLMIETHWNNGLFQTLQKIESPFADSLYDAVQDGSNIAGRFLRKYEAEISAGASLREATVAAGQRLVDVSVVRGVNHLTI